jgi:hypothetical protein
MHAFPSQMMPSEKEVLYISLHHNISNGKDVPSSTSQLIKLRAGA